MVGERFGKWVVLSIAKPKARGFKRFLCRCDCGTEKTVSMTALTRGTSRSCGCSAVKRNAHIGKRFGDLTVVGFIGPSGRSLKYLCVCDCGNTHSATIGNLKTGNIKSCGCRRKTAQAHRRKGPDYPGVKARNVWQGMIDRCSNPNNHAYYNYGGRGITVCEEWLEFESFYNDMGDPPIGLSIERVDNSKGYSKNNCKWATRDEQANNRRTNRKITFGGETKTLSGWSGATGLSGALISYRIRQGHDMDSVFSPAGALIQTRKPCCADGCDRLAIAKGMCDKHYRRVTRGKCVENKR